MARKYLDLDRCHRDDPYARIFGQSQSPAAPRGPRVESFTPDQCKPAKLPEWAEKALRRLDVPKSSVNPSRHLLPNGLKLIVQPEAVSDTVSVFGHVRNNPDMEAPEGKRGRGSGAGPALLIRHHHPGSGWPSRKPLTKSAPRSRRVPISACRFWPTISRRGSGSSPTTNSTRPFRKKRSRS